MSRKHDLIIARREIGALREKNAELRGELRGEHRVAEHLANDIRAGAVREKAATEAASKARTDVHRLMRLVAVHVLDVRGAGDSEHVETLLDALEAKGFSLTGAILAEQTARADAAARKSAEQVAAFVAGAAAASKDSLTLVPPAPASLSAPGTLTPSLPEHPPYRDPAQA